MPVAIAVCVYWVLPLMVNILFYNCISLLCGFFDQPHFTDEETEAQKDVFVSLGTLMLWNQAL